MSDEKKRMGSKQYITEEIKKLSEGCTIDVLQEILKMGRKKYGTSSNLSISNLVYRYNKLYPKTPIFYVRRKEKIKKRFTEENRIGFNTSLFSKYLAIRLTKTINIQFMSQSYFEHFNDEVKKLYKGDIFTTITKTDFIFHVIFFNKYNLDFLYTDEIEKKMNEVTIEGKIAIIFIGFRDVTDLDMNNVLMVLPLKDNSIQKIIIEKNNTEMYIYQFNPKLIERLLK